MMVLLRTAAFPHAVPISRKGLSVFQKCQDEITKSCEELLPLHMLCIYITERFKSEQTFGGHLVQQPV